MSKSNIFKIWMHGIVTQTLTFLKMNGDHTRIGYDV